jgi:hypothetical protein
MNDHQTRSAADGRQARQTYGPAEKVRTRPDGALVLMCDSGNPLLGLIFTPAGDGRVIATMPGDDGHPLSAASVVFDAEQLGALPDFTAAQASRTGASGVRVGNAPADLPAASSGQGAHRTADSRRVAAPGADRQLPGLAQRPTVLTDVH